MARFAAIQSLGRLRPPDAASLLRGVIERVQERERTDGVNSGWTWRLAAHALGRLCNVFALESLLDAPDWFARLGAAEVLAALPAA